MFQNIKRFFIGYNWKYISVFTLFTPFLGFGLYQIFINDEILYHSIAEAVTILSAIVILIVLISVWNLARENTFVAIACISTFIAAIIDIFHIFAYPGLTYFPSSYAPGTLITSFWIFARYFQVISILLAIILHQYTKKMNYFIVVFSLVSAGILGIVFIFLGFFPATYRTGVGLTTFKVISEYLIMFGFIISGYLIYRFKIAANNVIFSLYITFILFQVLTEYFFTTYFLPTDYALFIGHYFKILASFILMYILLRETIIAPNKQLYGNLVEQRNRLGKLLNYEKLTREIMEICVSATDTDTFLNEVLEIFGSTLMVDHSFLYKHIKERGVFKLTNHWFSDESKLRTDDDGYEYYVVPEFLDKMLTKETHYCSDTSSLDNPYERETFFSIGIFSYINEPIFVRGEFYGFIGYNMTTTNRERLNDDVTLVKSIGKIISQTIERIDAYDEIEYMSHHDNLTGAYNRRYFETLIPKVDNPDHYPLGMVVIDLNGLKLINDAFGHLAGDEMLKNTVDLLSSHLDKRGTLCRIGGDEFVVLISKTSSDEVYKMFNTINKKCEDIFVNSVQLSLAYGVHVRTSNSSLFYEEFKIAEDEMYRMKLLDVPSMRANAIDTILTTLFEKDQYSKKHSSNVSELASRLASKMGLYANEVNDIKMAGILHDIGKIIIPDPILKKQGKLDTVEYIEIKKHAEIGYRILSSSKDFRKIANFVLSHHEFYNGKGYPQGLEGEQIPVESRIISVVDAFDAMISYRSYRKSISVDEALAELENCSGTQFDPAIVKVFKEHYESIIDGLYNPL